MQQQTPAEQPANLTTYEVKRARFFELFEFVLDEFKNDITSGLEEGLYEADDNVENLAKISEGKTLLEEMKNHQPSIYLYIDGGNLQGISATQSMDVELFDKDNYEASWQEDGTNDYDYSPEEWEKMTEEMEAKKEIKGIY